MGIWTARRDNTGGTKNEETEKIQERVKLKWEDMKEGEWKESVSNEEIEGRMVHRKEGDGAK